MFKTTLLMNNGQMVKWSQNGQIYFKNPAANAASVFGHFGTLLMREFMKALDWPNLFERNGDIGTKRFNSFHVNVPFLYPLKTPENRRFSDIFRGYRNETLAWKRLLQFTPLLSLYNHKKHQKTSGMKWVNATDAFEDIKDHYLQKTCFCCYYFLMLCFVYVLFFCDFFVLSQNGLDSNAFLKQDSLLNLEIYFV